MSETRFTVVVPVHNKASHIGRALKSVGDQTYRNFEVVIVDDASTDGSMAIIKSMRAEGMRIYGRDSPGAGGYAARNYGIEKARGDWIAFIDADDEWKPNHLQALSEAIDQYDDTDVAIIGCGWTQKTGIESSTDRYFMRNHQKGIHLIGFPEFLRHSLNGERPIWTSVACIRAGRSAQGMFPEGRAPRGGDIYAFIRVIANNGAILWSPHIGGVYHMDSANMVTRSAYGYGELPELLVNELGTNWSPQTRKMIFDHANWFVWAAKRAQKLNGGYGFVSPFEVRWRATLRRTVKILVLGVIPGHIFIALSRLKPARRV